MASESTITKFGKNDPRYESLTRGNNARWQGTPEYIYVPATADEAVAAFGEIRKSSTAPWPVARGGGHCYIESVDKVASDYSVIDLGLLNQIGYDADKKWIWVEAGCRLGEVYKYLFRRWGVTIPGGSCATVGVGGHVAGGGYGLLSRLHGITVDHLHGVEVITAQGVKKVCTREHAKDSEEYKLWWSHTGGGGGNFGIVTKYLFRTHGKTADDIKSAKDCLPPAPARVQLMTLRLPWGSKADKAEFVKFLGRYGEWCVQADESRGASDRLFGLFRVKTPGSVAENDAVHLTVQVAEMEDTDAERDLSNDVLRSFNENAGVNAALAHFGDRAFFNVDDLPWLEATQQLSGGDWYSRAKQKSAFHRSLTGDHVSRIVEEFESPSVPGTGDRIPGGQGALVSLDTYGGKVNDRASLDTAYSHRDSTIKVQYQSYWGSAEDDYGHLDWIDQAYSRIYGGTGGEDRRGYPVPAHEKGETTGDSTDGCFVNYLDNDLPDAPSEQHFYGRMYWGPKTFDQLRKFKAAVDRDGVFTSAQPVPPAVGE